MSDNNKYTFQISDENQDALNALEMNGLVIKKENGAITGYHIPIDCLNQALTFLRDYYIVLGKGLDTELLEEWEQQYLWAVEKLRDTLGIIRNWQKLNPDSN